MRRGSIIGPVLLILIGVLFLINNLRPDISPLDLLLQHWPFLLIGWGVLRLVEVFFWHFRGRPVPARGISGGEWVLIVFICLIGSGFFFVKRNIGSLPGGAVRIRGIEVFGESFDYKVEERKIPAGANPRVIIENLRGSARVTGGDVAEVRVSGRKTIRALQRSEADSANQATPLEVTSQGATVIIRTNQERAFSDRHIQADLEIVVPKGSTIEGRGRYGDFDISDISGGVEISSDNAGVRVQNIAGNVRCDLRRSDIVRAINVQGEVEIKGRGETVELENIAGPVTVNGSYYGDLQFRNVTKPIRFEGHETELRVERCPGELRVSRGQIHGQDLVGPLRITGRTKDIQLSEFTGSLELQLDRGDIELRPARIPLATMNVKTGAGDILFSVPENAGFTLRGTVNKGEVQNDYGGALNVETMGREQSVSGSVGDGPVITLHSDRGTLTIRRGVLDVIPPMPPRSPVPPRQLEVERN